MLKSIITEKSNELLIAKWVGEGIGTYEEILRVLRNRHSTKRANAKGRGIEFLLTFDEHCGMLLQDYKGKPVFKCIGRKEGQLCLMRNEDKGSYEVGNCYYGLFSQNSSESVRKFRNLSKEHRQKISAAHKGRTFSEEHRHNISEAAKRSRKGKTGLRHNRSKPANVYDYITGDLVAERVALREWSRQNGYTSSLLSETATGNRKQHKGVYAKYL